MISKLAAIFPRTLTLGLMIIGMVSLQGCGKKGDPLSPDPTSPYPNTYPKTE